MNLIVKMFEWCFGSTVTLLSATDSEMRQKHWLEMEKQKECVNLQVGFILGSPDANLLYFSYFLFLFLS